MRMSVKASFFQFFIFCLYFYCCSGCTTVQWRNMTIVEILLRSDVVVYGKDVQHGKFRIPTELDARFDIHCVLRAQKARIPGQIIIENIRKAEPCLGTTEQTEVNQTYILGLTREMSGFMTYANVNSLQKSAFLASQENLDVLAATCGLDFWNPPHTGDQSLCPSANKPRFCTKFRFQTSDGSEFGHFGFLGIFSAIVIRLVV